MNTTINVTEAATAELVKFYNAHADKTVKKFRDRATAEQRVNDLLAELAETQRPETDLTRSEAISKSWANPETRAKRSQRHPVYVDGVEYNSVRSAFVALNLPLKKHIAFRVSLVEQVRNGGPNEADYDGHKFELIDPLAV